MILGGDFLCTPRQAQSCCGSSFVAHMRSEVVPTSFLELPGGRENRISN